MEDIAQGTAFSRREPKEYPDRLVITNPGRLPDGWKGRDVGHRHQSLPTNPDLAQVFHLRGLMEQLGLGAHRIITECKKLGAKPPKWKAETTTVSLTLFRVQYSSLICLSPCAGLGRRAWAFESTTRSTYSSGIWPSRFGTDSSMSTTPKSPCRPISSRCTGS